MEPPAPPQYSFGPFLLDPAEKVLLRDGHPVALPPKAIATLVALTERPGHIVEKAELLNRVWPDTFVEEATLAQNIFTLRKVLGESSDGHPYIETVPKRGYRFVYALSIARILRLQRPRLRGRAQDVACVHSWPPLVSRRYWRLLWPVDTLSGGTRGPAPPPQF